MAFRTVILTIGTDATLQSTRSMLLKQAGYSVIELDTDSSVLEFLESETEVDLVLICHSVEETSKMRLCAALKNRYPATPILMFQSYLESVPPQVTASLQSLGPPKELLHLVHKLVGRSRP